MDKFGPHTAEVQEVVDFIESGKVLSEPFRQDLFDDFDTRVVDSLEDVYRFQRGHRPNPEHWYEDKEWWGIMRPDEKLWDKACAKMGRDWPPIKQNMTGILYLFQDSLKYKISEDLPKEDFFELPFVISDEFEKIMQFRAIFGKNNYIYEKMFRVYQAFGHPCSWVGGIYPKGQLVVLSRQE